MKSFARLFQNDSYIILLVGFMLLVLVPLLAILQYKWVGQISEAERDQMKTNLKNTAARIADEFNSDITRTYVAFAPNNNEIDDEKLFAEKFQQWIDTTHDPKIVSSIFIATPTENNSLELKQFALDSRTFMAQEWKTLPAPIAENLLQRQKQIRQNLQRWPQDSQPQRNPLPAVYGDFPGFSIPVFSVPKGIINQPPTFHGFILLLFDKNHLLSQYFPEILKKHLDVANYDLAVVNRNDQVNVIWQTANANFSSFDASQVFFGLRGDEFRNLMRLRQQNQPAFGPRFLSFAPFGDENRPWELRIKHRSGSLEAAVGQVRRRNLFLSSGILLLLVASVTLLMISVRRAKGLAQQQMDFVAGISHELRTPLAVIDSAGYNLTKGVIKDEKQLSRYGSLIRKETRHLQEMVEQILEFAGVQSGKMTYDLQPTDAHQMILNVLASTQPLLSEGGFTVETNIAPSLPYVFAESAALSRTIVNLINNAMKYGGEKKWIGVTADVVKTNHGDEVQISVADQGMGIPLSEQTHIFEPFYRGAEAKSAQIRGNGLGLSLVKNIVTAHKGKVFLESTEGKGSKFTISLPAISQEAMQASGLAVNSVSS